MRNIQTLAISIVFLFAFHLVAGQSTVANEKEPRFRVLAIAENGGNHVAYSTAAKKWLSQLASDSSFTIDYLQNPDTIDDEFLGHYQLFIQLDFPPYMWKKKSMDAFQKYIESGKGGWIGFHHATLLGEFDGYPIWPWFSDFMGGIRFKNYIAKFAAGTVHTEDAAHPVMKGVPASFVIAKDEWYTYDKSPRPNVDVIASVDESTYAPPSPVTMGDHPVIWSNPKMKARNVYIFMGHAPELFNDPNYVRMFRNAIFWAAKPRFKALVVLSKAKDHIRMMTCAEPFLKRIGEENNFQVDYTDDTSKINDNNLKRYQVFVMLQLAPFDMSVSQQAALQKFAVQGHGWVGVHAAGLTGKMFVKPSRQYWQWFEDFMGGISYSPHPKFQPGTVRVEDATHPAMKNLPAKFEISDEWYEFDKSPRDKVRVLATADESTYTQNKPMGDHPIIWTNQRFHRMIYIGIGHDATMCTDKNFEILVRDAILWAAEK